MSYYEILLFLHVATAIVWLGGGALLQTLVFRAERTTDPVLMKKLAESAKWLAQRFFIPSSLAVLVFGILLTIEGPWSFGDLWIVLGLAGYAVSFLTGILFLEPEGKRIDAAITAHGPDSREARHHVRRINVVQRVELTILFLVVVAMSLKPTGDDTGTLLLIAAVLVAAALLGARALARPLDVPGTAQVQAD
jgi:uncharacterized membrane protein